MSTFYRYDAIQLNDDAKEEDFIKLMKETILPHFESSYSKVTRVSECVLGSQEIFKDAKKERKYIWLNTWDGREDAIFDLSFTGVTLFTKLELETFEVLKKIDKFGKRKIANVYATIE